jgi:chemotaxis-related protein WspD
MPGLSPLYAPVEDCWNQIGVIGGNRTCPKLEQFVHCRNCPVYAESGARLLDRELPADYREEWTRRFAEQKTAAAAAKLSVVIFHIGQEWLALPTPFFQEVAERPVIRSLPHQRNRPVLGLANVRGELLVCISLPRLLGAETDGAGGGPLPAHGRLLVVGQHGQRLAFPVDGVHGVHRFQPQEVASAPAIVTRAVSTLTRGLLPWKDRRVGLLDAELLFSTFNRSFA